MGLHELESTYSNSKRNGNALIPPEPLELAKLGWLEIDPLKFDEKKPLGRVQKFLKKIISRLSAKLQSAFTKCESHKLNTLFVNLPSVVLYTLPDSSNYVVTMIALFPFLLF